MSVHSELWNYRTAANTDTLKAFRAHQPAECAPHPFHSWHLCACVHQNVWNCVCFCGTRNLPCTHVPTQVSHPWPCGQMLYKSKKGILKPWHITSLCTRSDSNPTWPCSTAPIILWICYGVLMLTVYPGFIIITSVPHKGSAEPTRGSEGKQTELPRSGIQFIMAKDKKLPKF